METTTYLAPKLMQGRNGDLTALCYDAAIRIFYTTTETVVVEEGDAEGDGRVVSLVPCSPKWVAVFSVRGTDTSYVCDEGMGDWSNAPKSSKYDRRKPEDRTRDLAMADAREAWSDHLAQWFVWNAYRHCTPAVLDKGVDGMWPSLESIVLEW